MKTLVHLLLLSGCVLASTSSFAQLRHVKTQTVKIYGNCGSCEKTIEKAGNSKKAASVDWNEQSKTATITYDSTQTTIDEVLQRIAVAGYDNERFLAPDAVYAGLPACCQYKRELKPSIAADHHTATVQEGSATDVAVHAGQTQAASALQPVFDGYFALKDALVKSDAALATTSAGSLLKVTAAVDMRKLENAEHTVWMKVVKNIDAGVSRIAQSKDLIKQREALAALATPMYELAKASKIANPVYYQHCPMYDNGKGGNWLSRESAVKNPFYGSQMLTCGSTVETIENK